MFHQFLYDSLCFLAYVFLMITLFAIQDALTISYENSFKYLDSPPLLIVFFLVEIYFVYLFYLLILMFPPAFQVLVGTGSRTMKIIKIKSLKVYAFGFCKPFWFHLIPLHLYYPPQDPSSHSLSKIFPYRCSSFIDLWEVGSKVCFYSSGWIE